MHRLDFLELFERLPSPHMVLDRELKFVGVNAAYEAAVLRDRGDLIGNNLFDMFPNEGEGGQRLRTSLQRVLDTGEADTLAYLGYDIPRPAEQGGGVEQRYWTAVHVPLRDAQGDVAFVLQNTVDVTEIVRLRQATSLPFRAFSGEAQLIERAREAESAHRALMAESSEFRRMFQQAPGFIAVVSGPTHVFTFANDAYVRLVGGRSVVGLPVAEALPEVVDQGFVQMLDIVFGTGQQRGGEGVRVMLQKSQEDSPRETFLDFSYDAIKDLDGNVTGVFVQGMDRTEAVRTLKKQRLLLDELNHRVKNTLATVQSIASQTLRSAPDMASAKAAFEARIVALSKAHNVLSSRQWASAELHTLVCGELAAHGQSRVQHGGPRVALNPKASIAIAMVIHELATNAAKYGALSGPEGRVSVSWKLGDEEDLILEWKEVGGPHVSKPTHRGFGSRMIERVVTGELSGSYDCGFAPGGFACRIEVPHGSYRQLPDAFEQ